MTKNVNGDTYSDLITSANPNVMYSSATPGVTGYGRLAIDRIVVHHNATTNKDVAMNTWMVSSGNWTSAHYEITPTEIIGCVGEQYSAFHSGDATMNRRSIGLEHLNETGAPNWTVADATLRNSAKLIADICKRYGFYPDAQHIIPHRSVSSTACPGGLDMNKLIRYAQEAYNGKATATTTTTTTQTKKEDTLEVNDMFMVTADKRGTALMQGGRFLAILDPKDVTEFQKIGIKAVKVSQKTFDEFQKRGK